MTTSVCSHASNDAQISPGELVVPETRAALDALHLPDSSQFRHPRCGVWPSIMNCLANSHRIAAIRRAVMSRLPFLTLQSDVTDVVYLTWMVETSRVQSFVPSELKLRQFGERTPLTILTYRHGHFGPCLAGPLRRLFPSPLQSNWRLYLLAGPSIAPSARTVLFLKNVMDSSFYSLGTRLFSDALLTHLADSLSLDSDRSTYQICIQSGNGNAPELNARLTLSDVKELPSSFQQAFSSWETAAEYLTRQDAAITLLPTNSQTVFSEIDLPIELATLQPLKLEQADFHCPIVQSLCADSPAFCFLLPKVRFRALSERLLTTSP